MVEQAVILAESASSADGSVPGDPCRVLLGLGLLERMVMTLAHGGIRRILVLSREGGKSINDLAAGAKVWQRSGADVRLAAPGKAELPLPEAPFLLLEGMVVFGSELAKRLHQCQVVNDQFLVPDAGHGAPSGFSGLVLCRAAFFPRLSAASDGASPNRSMEALLDAAPPLAVAGGGWVRVHSRQGEKQARRLLRLSLGKPSDGFFSRHLNRHISWPISRLLIRLRVRPTQVTVANLALGLLSGWLIGRGGYGNTLAAGLLFQFVSIFDGCDGEIARLTFRFSALGAKLDNLCDFITLLAFYINLPVGLYAASADPSHLALGAGTMLGVALFYLLLLARIKLSGHHGNIAEVARQVQEKDKTGKPLHWLERLGVHLGFIYRKEFISLYAMVWCLLGRAEVFLWTTVILVSVGLVYQVYSILKLAGGKWNS